MNEERKKGREGGMGWEGWMDGRTDGWMDGRTDGWTDGRMDGRTDGRTDGWMDGWMDEDKYDFSPCLLSKPRWEFVSGMNTFFLEGMQEPVIRNIVKSPE